jgi:hypothetical protein
MDQWNVKLDPTILSQPSDVDIYMGMPQPEVQEQVAPINYQQAFSPEVPTKSLYPSWQEQNMANTPGLNNFQQPIQIVQTSNVRKYVALGIIGFIAFKIFQRRK